MDEYQRRMSLQGFEEWQVWRDARTAAHKCHCHACWRGRDTESPLDDLPTSIRGLFEVVDGKLVRKLEPLPKEQRRALLEGSWREPEGVLVGKCGYCGMMHRRPSGGGWLETVSEAKADRVEAECEARKRKVTGEPRARTRKGERDE